MKYLKYILILIFLVGLFSLGPWIENSASADASTSAQSSQTNKNYQLLAPLPGAGGQPITKVDPTKGLGSYLNLMIKIFIGLCAVLSVVMIVMGGLEYMTSELISSKESGKDRIVHALLGLLIALGAYALLFTINPDLLKSDVNIQDTTVTVTVPEIATENCSEHEIKTKEECEKNGFTWTPSGSSW